MGDERIRLYASGGETSAGINAKTSDSGDLQLSGYDVGPVPDTFFGDLTTNTGSMRQQNTRTGYC